jgi:uncharacterized protein (DUF1697 family)
MAALKGSRAILLRGVNVGGNTRVPMPKLRAFLEMVGLADVRTFLNSGNAVARGGPADALALERRLERDAERHLGVRVDFHVRSRSELQSIVDANPFPRAAKEASGRLLVFFLRDAIEPSNVLALRGGIKGRETCECVDRHLYVVYPDGMGRSKLSSSVVERVLGARGTARNWNTVLKLAALASAIDRI